MGIYNRLKSKAFTVGITFLTLEPKIAENVCSFIATLSPILLASDSNSRLNTRKWSLKVAKNDTLQCSVFLPDDSDFQRSSARVQVLSHLFFFFFLRSWQSHNYFMISHMMSSDRYTNDVISVCWRFQHVYVYVA